MDQRQLRLGDTLDDYCPRERRLTNHAIVAMVGPDVKQTRCTACDTEHEYKHAKVPRQRRKPDSPAALYGQVAAGAPKRVVHDPSEDGESPENPVAVPLAQSEPVAAAVAPAPEAAPEVDEPSDEEPSEPPDKEEGPVHRPLIRASLPRADGQPPPARPIPEFTIRQPGGRPGSRFRPRHQRGGGTQQFFGGRSNGNTGGGGGPQRGGGQRPGGGRPPQGGDPSRPGRRHGPGRRRDK